MSVGGEYPEAAGELSEHMDSVMARPSAGYLPYGERKPYVVADSLATLTGPSPGGGWSPDEHRLFGRLAR
jgi:hypothetical protein